MNLTETGTIVYNRTYSRTKPDGTQETWPETVVRVVDGNLALSPDHTKHTSGEREDLIRMILHFKLIPAGRHLWACGVPGAQHLMNCWASGFTEVPSEHFAFTFGRLMEGGGVGANYSNKHLAQMPVVQHYLRVHIVCDPEHKDYEKMREAGILSNLYDSGWAGSFPVEDSREGWADALVDLIDTHYREDVIHLDRVYDVSRVRPAGARLKTFGGTASGPMPLGKMLQDVSGILSELVGLQLDGLSAMEIDHAIAQCVVAGGVRRSARMAMMHWDDPQILDFINIKQASGSHWTTNISVEVDDEFWRLVDLPPNVCRDLSAEAHAKKVLKLLSEGAVRNGEPGIWDSSVSNVGEPSRILVTNPCGEIGLNSSEPCNLGHINLAAFVDESTGDVDYEELQYAHTLMTRFLIRATFAQVSDPESRRILDRNRRIGVGHTGVASFLAMTGQKYSDICENRQFKNLLITLSTWVDDAATRYSHDLRIPVPVKKRTVAPTGTISKMPGVSEGIHPIFSRYFIRRIRFSVDDERQAQMLQDYRDQGYLVEPDLWAENADVVSIATKDSLVEATARIWGDEFAEELVESADELTLHELLEMQKVYQLYWADNAVSFTANVDPDRYTPEDVAQELLFFGGTLKGTTVFPESSMPQAPYERLTKEQYDAAFAKAVADGVDENCANGSCPIR